MQKKTLHPGERVIQTARQELHIKYKMVLFVMFNMCTYSKLHSKSKINNKIANWRRQTKMSVVIRRRGMHHFTNSFAYIFHLSSKKKDIKYSFFSLYTLLVSCVDPGSNLVRRASTNLLLSSMHIAFLIRIQWNF